MEDKDQNQNQNQNQVVNIKICEECKTNESKYKCPACSLKTCSLSCVNSHKLRLSCSGKPHSTTHFLPLSHFDDSTLLSDYNMLEDVKRVAESAKRMRLQLRAYYHGKLPRPLKALTSAAAKRGTKLILLPDGMSKRKNNRTYLNYRRKSIFWTIEWRFQSVDVVLLEHGVLETSTLRSVIEKHLQPSPWRTKLRRFCEESLDNLKFFIRKYHKGSKAPYREMDINTPIRYLFSKLVILEYPVIHVFLPSDSYDFEVIREDLRPPPIRPDSTIPKRNESPTHAGIVFKEEEIVEREGNLETQVIDLSKNERKPTSRSVNKHFKQSSGSSNSRLVIDRQSNSSGINEVESEKAHKINNGKEVEVFYAETSNFDFDQDLIDAYSFLMEENNPDEFLNFKLEGDGEHDIDLCLQDIEELEEGEIPVSP